MDFSYSEEQQLLKDSVDRFVREAYEFDKRQKLTKTDLGFSRDNWSMMAELGWLGVSLPEEFGGFDGGPVETMIIMEAIGSGLVLEPFLPTVVLGGGLLKAAGSDDQKRELLPALAEGKMMLAFAFAERQSRYDMHDVELSAKKNGSGYVLNGHKGVVVGAPSADKVIVTARTGGGNRDREGVTLFLVDADAAGLARRDYPTVDSLRASELTFDNVKVDDGAVLGTVDQAMPAVDRVVDEAIAAISAEAVGAMQVLLDTTNEYLKTRKQFGQPLSRFQVLQHRMVDMFMEVEQSRSMALMVTLKLDEDEAERRKAAAGAKVQIGKSSRFVGQQSVQLHGGMGMTDELNVGHYFKRLTMIDIMFGNQDYHLKRYADMV